VVEQATAWKQARPDDSLAILARMMLALQQPNGTEMDFCSSAFAIFGLCVN
jgi:hypothetical protein